MQSSIPFCDCPSQHGFMFFFVKHVYRCQINGERLKLSQVEAVKKLNWDVFYQIISKLLPFVFAGLIAKKSLAIFDEPQQVKLVIWLHKSLSIQNACHKFWHNSKLIDVFNFFLVSKTTRLFFVLLQFINFYCASQQFYIRPVTF